MQLPGAACGGGSLLTARASGSYNSFLCQAAVAASKCLLKKLTSSISITFSTQSAWRLSSEESDPERGDPSGSCWGRTAPGGHHCKHTNKILHEVLSRVVDTDPVNPQFIGLLFYIYQSLKEISEERINT
jgi:hypothetical protein